MKQSEFIRLTETPYKADSSDMAKVEAMRTEFPYFQSAHLLLTLISKKYDSSLYQQTLRNTAISIPNRAKLYHLLNELEAKSAEVSQKEEAGKIIPVQEVKAEEIKVEKKEEPVVEPKTEKKEEEVTEIDHLKAIELVTQEEEISEEEKLNKQVEKEIEKQIISSFIEKEVLHTPDLHKEEAQKKIDSGSFSDWIKALKAMDRVSEPLTQGEELKNTMKPVSRKEEQKSIIDKIIDSNPGNIRLNPNQKFYSPDKNAKEALFENEDLVTETLAKIYALQGNTNKAIRAYEILSLKFPQKSAYFATLIENLKKGNQ
jgi:hypothetical protein